MRALAWLLAAMFVTPAVAAIVGTNRSTEPSANSIHSTDDGPHLMPPDPISGAWPTGVRQRAPPAGPRSATVGTAKVLVLLIEFSDVAHEPSHDGPFFDRFLNDAAPGARSMRAYYVDASYGALTINATIVPTWFVSNHTMSYYGQDGSVGVDNANGPVYNLTAQAVSAADPFVDFSAFDADRDGVVDHLLVVHAGPGQEDHANRTDMLWSHSWVVVDADLVQAGAQALFADGVQVYAYTIISEDSPLGVPVHEFGHDLGLPDLYDTDYSSDGAGIWDVMSEGAWNGAPRGSSPALFSAWSKIRLRWLTPTSGPIDFAVDAPIPAVETQPFAYRLPVPGFTVESFLLENREPIAFDAALPAHGLLIWHVDDSQTTNDVDAHRLLDLEEADEGVSGDHPRDAGDPWHDTSAGFGPDTTPASLTYGGTPTPWRVRDISAIGDPMTATILDAVPVDLAVEEIRVPGTVAVGASVTARVVVRNEGGSPAAASLSVSVYRDELSPAALVRRENRTLVLARGTTSLVDVNVSATEIARYLIDAAVSTPGDGIPSDDTRIVHVSADVFAFRDDLESGPGNWTVGGGPQDNPRWTLLSASDPNGSAHSESLAWQFGFGSNRTPNPMSPPWRTLTSVPVNVTGAAFLNFYHRFNFLNATDSGSPGSARARVEVRYGGGPWAVLAAYAGRSTQWGGVSIPLAPPVFPTWTEVRFNATAADMPGAGGWWIDDVAIASRGLAHAVVLLPSSVASQAVAGAFASVRLKIANVGDFEDAFLVNASVLPGWGAAFAPPGGFPTLTNRTIVLAPDRDATLSAAFLAPLGVPAGSYVVTVLAAGPANARASASISITIVVGSTGTFAIVAAVAVVLGLAVALVGFLLLRRRARRPPT